MNDGIEKTITHSQIPILLNFAMTDYCSQGRTRQYNPVDLRKCPNHQSLYTCLLCCASLNGLLILYPFNSSRMKGGLPGDLRDKMHTLDILNEISQLQFQGQLHSSVNGSMRDDLIASFNRVQKH